MDALRVGRSLRVLRIRRGWRQSDLSSNADLSKSQVSRIEGGDIERMPLGDVMAAFRSVGADLDLRVRWHGEALDRLLDNAHADLANDVVLLLSRKGWASAVEVTFNEYGERGAIDILAWHQGRGVLLVVELKTVVPDVQAMISSHDRKVRLGSRIGQRRGWDARLVGGLLVIRDGRSARRRIEERRDLFEHAYPQRGRHVLRWLADPSGPCTGILFLPDSRAPGARRSTTGRRRVRLASGRVSGS